MSTAKQSMNGDRLAVFARNFRAYIEHAAEIATEHPAQLITFRSGKPWARAHDVLVDQGTMRVFFSPNGTDGGVEYEAVLRSVHRRPELGDGMTEKLLELCLDETKDESLWGKDRKKVKTLYVISNCKKLDSPFSMTKLIKESDGEPISPGYGYSYTVVYDHVEPRPNGDVVSPEEIAEPRKYLEGATTLRAVNAYERSSAARKSCLVHYGYDCAVCGFNFEKIFGAIGRGFIHVHHLTSLAEIEDEYEVDPIADLRPVCPNCHAMLHRSDPAYSISELQEILRVG